MRNSFIGRTLTGKDVIRNTSGNESWTNYAGENDYVDYDEDLNVSLENLEISVACYVDSIDNMLDDSIGNEDWDPTDGDLNYDLAEESWASIVDFFRRNGSKVSSFFKNMFKKAEKAKSDIEVYREKLSSLHADVTRLRTQLKDPKLSPDAKKTIQKNIDIRVREIKQAQAAKAEATRLQKEAATKLEAALSQERKGLHDVDKAVGAMANQRAATAARNKRVGELKPKDKKRYDSIKEKQRQGKKLTESQQKFIDSFAYDKNVKY